MRSFSSSILIVLMMFLTSNVFGASNDLDSLRKEILLSPDDTVKVLELKNLSYKYLKIQIDTSYSLIKKAVSLSEKLDYTYGYASSLNQMGLVFKYQAKYDSSLYYYQNSLQLFEKLGFKKDQASVLNRMGNVYKRFGKFDTSIECLIQSLNIYVELGDSAWQSSVLNNIGILYFDLGQHEKSIEYELKSLEIKKEMNNWKKIPITLMNIGNNYKQIGNISKALLYYTESYELMGDDWNKYDKAKLVHNIASTYEVTGKYDVAKRFYLEAIELEKEINYQEILVSSLQGMGNSLIKEGRFKEGEKYLLESFDLAKEINDLRKIHRLSINLYETYLYHGDFKNSVYYLKVYVDAEDSIFNREKKKLIVNLEEKYKAEKREQQIAFLEKEKEIQLLELKSKDAESKRKTFQRNILIIAILVLFCLIQYFYFDNRKRKKYNKLLIDQNKKIIEQQEEIETQNDQLHESNSTKDKLFQIIAHDLRSPIVSMESITQLIPYWIEEQDYKSLQKLSKTLQVSVHNVLSLIDNLLNWALNQQGKFPYTPENLNLEENLKETIDVYIPIAKVKKINLEFRPSESIMVFADKNMLSTVMRNLLNNAVKFTPESGDIVVGVDRDHKFAKVWIKDSGIGISVENKEKLFEIAKGSTKGTKGETGKGLGLFFCKEFVNINNGDIFIDSSPGKGTKITFTLPLFSSEKDENV